MRRALQLIARIRQAVARRDVVAAVADELSLPSDTRTPLPVVDAPVEPTTLDTPFSQKLRAQLLDTHVEHARQSVDAAPGIHRHTVRLNRGMEL